MRDAGELILDLVQDLAQLFVGFFKSGCGRSLAESAAEFRQSFLPGGNGWLTHDSLLGRIRRPFQIIISREYAVK